jgi:subtilisin family serine protease
MATQHGKRCSNTAYTTKTNFYRRELMKRTLLVLAIISSLILSATPIMAQDSPDAEDAGHKVFLPAVSAGSNTAQTTEQTTADTAGDTGDSSFVAGDVDGEVGNGAMTVEAGGLTAATTVTVDKNLVSAAARGADQFELVPLVVTFDAAVNVDALNLPNGTITHRFKKVFNGVSLVTQRGNVGGLASMAGVTGIYEDQLMQPQTEASPKWIGAPQAWNQLGGQESAGEGVIVGILDTGIWPEHPSFSDPDPSGKPYAAPPAAPGGPRQCQFGSAVLGDAPFTCNNKLIGAYKFLDTYEAFVGLEPNEFVSARDDEGHGTHTASTSAGNAGVAANIIGVPRGVVSGIAPRAHVIAYRVCGLTGCFGSDSAAAVEQAILDGVDVINF